MKIIVKEIQNDLKLAWSNKVERLAPFLQLLFRTSYGDVHPT